MLLLCTALCRAQSYDTTLIPYRAGAKWGYCNVQKKVVIAPQFTEADFFDQGLLATVRLDSYYCVINRRGEVVYKNTHFTLVVDKGTHFLATTNSYTEQLYDATGQPVTGVYNKINRFNSYGYAQIVSRYTRYGLIDRSFKEVIAPRYGSIEFFSPTLIKVYEDSTHGYGLVNISTGIRVPCKYQQVYPPREGLLMVLQDGKCGFIDSNGKVVLLPRYQRAVPEGIKAGQWYNESTYEGFNLDGLYCGLAVVTNDAGESGYINASGETVVPFRFERAYGFSNNRAWVKEGGKWGMIDTKGKYVLPPVYSAPAFLSAKELLVLDGFSEGLIPATRDSLYEYVDSNGTVVIPARFTRAEPFYDGMAAVYEQGAYGFISRKGQYIIRPAYPWIEGAGIAGTHPFVSGCAIAQKHDGRWVIIDKKGKKLLPIEFDKDNDIWFENGLANAKAGGKRYVFNNEGQVRYVFPADGGVSQYTPSLFYCYDDKCFININSRIKYCGQ